MIADQKGKRKKDLEHRVDVASLVGSGADHGKTKSKGDEASSLTGVEVKKEKRRLEAERCVFHEHGCCLQCRILTFQISVHSFCRKLAFVLSC